MNNDDHQEHNVETEFTGLDLPYIVHDSAGFQSGASNKEANAVRDFIRTRSKNHRYLIAYMLSGTSTKLLEAFPIADFCRYCIAAGSNGDSRPGCESDADLFAVLNECKSTIPVIVVCTKIDELKKSLYKGQEFGLRDIRQLSGDDFGNIEDKVANRVATFKVKIISAFVKNSQQYRYMGGPTFASKGTVE